MFTILFILQNSVYDIILLFILQTVASNGDCEVAEKRGHIVAGKYTEDMPKYQLILISRRNRYRAGTRYKRRGLDSTGAVANYVETELIIYVQGQLFSFVQVRGSIPVFWSQTGHRLKYYIYSFVLIVVWFQKE